MHKNKTKEGGDRGRILFVSGNGGEKAEQGTVGMEPNASTQVLCPLLRFLCRLSIKLVFYFYGVFVLSQLLCTLYSSAY